ncbi:hypothetical protein THERMOT_168 [Bathymodiolus thermophilus thioautotrophic gill symbiont]|nr:hypothetical protein THERMOT_168 [Bathymodiolus thermophilus thioautotrophic gill symbiont]
MRVPCHKRQKYKFFSMIVIKVMETKKPRLTRQVVRVEK